MAERYLPPQGLTEEAPRGIRGKHYPVLAMGLRKGGSGHMEAATECGGSEACKGHRGTQLLRQSSNRAQGSGHSDSQTWFLCPWMEAQRPSTLF